MLARGEAAAQLDDAALLAALVEVESALARAGAQRGLIPAAAAEAIAAVDARELDIAAIGRAGAEHAQPVVALVEALRAALPAPAAQFVHHGATSQDILDTALMLMSHRALAALIADLAHAGDRLAELAAQYAASPMTARTLMQRALGITFGVKAAGWMVALDAARVDLEDRRAGLPVGLAGPTGVLDDPELRTAFAAELGLAPGAHPWQADRRPVAALAAALGLAAGAAGKFATDVVLLAQSEVAELREAGDGGRSSAMAHKHNPVAAISVLAATRRTPQLVATILAAMPGEHERAAGAWQSEWQPWLELVCVTGSALSWTAELADRLEVDSEAMAGHLGDGPLDAATLASCQRIVAGALAGRPT